MFEQSEFDFLKRKSVMSDILRSCLVGGFATLLPPKESKGFL